MLEPGRSRPPENTSRSRVARRRPPSLWRACRRRRENRAAPRCTYPGAQTSGRFQAAAARRLRPTSFASRRATRQAPQQREWRRPLISASLIPLRLRKRDGRLVVRRHVGLLRIGLAIRALQRDRVRTGGKGFAGARQSAGSPNWRRRPRSSNSRETIARTPPTCLPRESSRSAGLFGSPRSPCSSAVDPCCGQQQIRRLAQPSPHVDSALTTRPCHLGAARTETHRSRQVARVRRRASERTRGCRYANRVADCRRGRLIAFERQLNRVRLLRIQRERLRRGFAGVHTVEHDARARSEPTSRQSDRLAACCRRRRPAGRSTASSREHYLGESPSHRNPCPCRWRTWMIGPPPQASKPAAPKLSSLPSFAQAVERRRCYRHRSRNSRRRQAQPRRSHQGSKACFRRHALWRAASRRPPRLRPNLASASSTRPSLPRCRCRASRRAIRSWRRSSSRTTAPWAPPLDWRPPSSPPLTRLRQR